MLERIPGVKARKQSVIIGLGAILISAGALIAFRAYLPTNNPLIAIGIGTGVMGVALVIAAVLFRKRG